MLSLPDPLPARISHIFVVACNTKADYHYYWLNFSRVDAEPRGDYSKDPEDSG